LFHGACGGSQTIVVYDIHLSFRRIFRILRAGARFSNTDRPRGACRPLAKTLAAELEQDNPMKKIVLGVLAVLAVSATAASAQYYPPPPGWGYQPPAYRPPPPPPYGYPPPRSGYGYGYGRLGYRCVAVRNTVCRLARPAPIGAYCECLRREGGKREGYVQR
jgi:hypothetical protein